jgi:hypothetical protein
MAFAVPIFSEGFEFMYQLMPNPSGSSIFFYPFQYILNAAIFSTVVKSVKTGLIKPCKLAYFSMVDFNRRCVFQSIYIYFFLEFCSKHLILL